MIADILKAKGSDITTVRPDAKISTLVRLLSLENIGSAVVSQDGAHVLGIISERDVVRALVTYGSELLGMRVDDLMTRAVISCTRDDSIKDVMSKMTHQRVRHVPVIEKGELRGIVSIGDVVKSRLEDLEMETNVLRDFITAR